MSAEASFQSVVAIHSLTGSRYFGHRAESIERDLDEPGGPVSRSRRLEAQLRRYQQPMIAGFGWVVLVGVSSER